jgi:hypothetical protein
MRYALFTLSMLMCLTAGAQGTRPSFGPPLEIPLYLSGNFAELRRNHFHTGIDIKTQGVEGQKVLAAEEGHVVRIAVSGSGYGKVLYIAHPNGYTTVYGHLKSFAPKIDRVVKAEQYAQERFAIDFNPAEPIAVSRGELIALSGNTGSSGGPHLHFEIRNTATGRAQNPLLFGFNISDRIPPRIRGLRFHPLSDTSLVNGKPAPYSVATDGDNGKYQMKAGQKVQVYGAFGISVHSIDFLDGQQNRCGIYRVALEVEGREVLAQQFDEIDFVTSRHINSYKDYEAFRNQSWHYHKSFREPGNALEIYTGENGASGVLAFGESGTKQGRYTITDAYGNTSVLPFTFEVLDRPNGAFAKPETYDAYFYRTEENTFEYGDELVVRIPPKALYNDLPFQFGREMPTERSATAWYQVHRDAVPLDKPIVLEFNIAHITRADRPYLVGMRKGSSGGPVYIAGQTFGESTFSITSKDFGKFALALDKDPPELSARNHQPGMKIGPGSMQEFTIGDAMSGVQKHDAWLNGKWVLMEYEPKQKKIWFIGSDWEWNAGPNTLEIAVTDWCGNEVRRTYTYTH